MNWSNIWKHPATSVVGVLTAVVIVGGVFIGQGVTLGHAGTGTVMQLIVGVAIALIGLFSKDPGGPAGPAPLPGSTAKLGAWALIALLLPLPFLGGCTASAAAQDIVNWTPALQSAVATVDSTAALLAPADAPIFVAATFTFNAGSNLLIAQAKAYLANPSTSVLATLQEQAVALQQNVDAALLQVARIISPASQEHALAAINSVATIVNLILGIVNQIHGSTIAALSSSHTITMARLDPYTDHGRIVATVAAHYSISPAQAAVQVAQARAQLAQAGF